MDTEKLKAKLNDCLDYLYERDSYEISFKQIDSSTIRINIENSCAADGTTYINVENWGLSDKPNWNVFVRLGSVTATWASDGQLKEYANYVEDIQYLVKSIQKAMGIK